MFRLFNLKEKNQLEKFNVNSLGLQAFFTFFFPYINIAVFLSKKKKKKKKKREKLYFVCFLYESAIGRGLFPWQSLNQ